MILFPAWAAILCIGPLLIITNHDRPKAKHFRTRLAVVAAVIVIGVLAGAIFVWRLLNSSASGPNGWERVSWRAHLFAGKAEGDIPDLSWRELWFMTHVHGGFNLQDFVRQGYSLEGALVNPYTMSEDYQAGAQIFRERCAACHGSDGTGGVQAPRLNRSGLRHGDSDLAMYKVVRDGIPQTGMAPVAMSPQERWQVIGYLRTLQLATSNPSTERLLPLGIQVGSEQIRAAGSRSDQWLTYSGSLDGRRYTPLTDITPENVSRLRVRWIRQFDATRLKTEATPIVVGGVIFTVDPPSDVTALDVKSGELIWRYRRTLPDRLPTFYRTNRGLAILGNVLFLGSLDDYLVALNTTNGSVIWQTAVANPSEGFTMTGAPLIVNRSVVVGVAGGEYGIRGFLAAYDAETGRQQWKFNTIPGPGEFGHDTWKNNAWQSGGGATWVTGSYDPSLDLLYWGVGNPAPGMQGDVRPGDNLFTNSMVALHGESGKLAWFFQFTPHDEHDWDAAQTPILADIPIKGVLRRVLCVANRNGFYYVLDRTTGEFLIGIPFVEQNWARDLDSAGRPILSSDSEVTRAGRLTKPGVGGGANWQNSAFDNKRGLIFVPATEGASVFTKSPNPKHGDLGFYPGSAGSFPYPDPVVRALDVATGVKKWERFVPNWTERFAVGHSGLLATGGGLVFGTSGGYAFAIDSERGRELWRVLLGGDTYAAPISFTVDGHQVILMSAGQALFEFGL
jgi:alcohol dehydrogenase (cytochrome c)